MAEIPHLRLSLISKAGQNELMLEMQQNQRVAEA
jgi:hypothetical protein